MTALIPDQTDRFRDFSNQIIEIENFRNEFIPRPPLYTDTGCHIPGRQNGQAFQ
jgi:hypothetical protein